MKPGRRRTSFMNGTDFPNPDRFRHTRAGFSLIEVLVAAAVFFVLSGGILAVVTAAIRVPNELALAEIQSARSEAFARFARELFRNLPADAVVEQRIRQWQGRGEIPELLIRFAGSTLAAIPGATGTGLAVSGIPDGAGRFRVSMTTFDASATEADRDRQLASATWVGLMPDIERIQWQFLDREAEPVTRTWDAERPALVELTWTVSGSEGERVLIDIPRVDAVGGQGGGRGEPADDE